MKTKKEIIKEINELEELRRVTNPSEIKQLLEHKIETLRWVLK